MSTSNAHQKIFSINKPAQSKAQEQSIQLFMKAVNMHFNKSIPQKLEVNGKLHALSFTAPGSLLYLEKDYKNFNTEFTLKEPIRSDEYAYFNKITLRNMDIKECTIDSIDNNILLFGSMKLSEKLNINTVNITTPLIIFINKVEIQIDKETKKLILVLCDQKRIETGEVSITSFKDK